MTMVNNRNYSLAIKSNQIFMPPTMSAPVNITGYYGELMYYKLLADRLGIEFNVIHVGDYKAYGENLIKEHISKEYKENIERMYNRKYNNFVNNIAAERKVNHDFINIIDVFNIKYVVSWIWKDFATCICKVFGIC